MVVDACVGVVTCISEVANQPVWYKYTSLGYPEAEDRRHIHPIHSSVANVLGMSNSTLPPFVTHVRKRLCKS